MPLLDYETQGDGFLDVLGQVGITSEICLHSQIFWTLVEPMGVRQASAVPC